MVQLDKARNKHDRPARRSRSVDEIEAALQESLRQVREADHRSAHMLERIKTRLYYCAESSRQHEENEHEHDNDTMIVTMREWLGTPRAGGPRDPLALARQTLQLRARLQLLQCIDERNTTSVDDLLDRAHRDGLLALRACRR